MGRTSRLVGLLTTGTLCLSILGASPAQADVREVDPCGGTTVDGVMVSGSVWLAGCSGYTKRSTDAGATWQTVGFTTIATNVPVAADGSGGFWSQGGGWLRRMDAAGTVTKVAVSTPELEYLAVDGSGQLWGLSCPVASQDGGPWKLYTVNKATGATSLVADGGPQFGCYWGVTYRKPLRVDDAGHVLIPYGPNSKLVPNGGGGFAVQPLAPFAESGGVTLSAGGVGGIGWDTGKDITALPGQPNYVVVEGEGLYRRDGDGVWAAARREFATPAGDAVIVPTLDQTRLQVITGDLDGPLFVSEPIPADSQRMIDQVNLMRAQAGMTTRLLGDARISQAAANHARYWALNDPTNQGQGLHNETPGKPGFTGADMLARCQAVGTVCGTEVMYPEISSEVDAAAGWVATIFHRAFLMNPGAARTGGSLISGMAVMNTEGTPGIVGRPFGYPTGVYYGPRRFAGELPDPGQECVPGTGKATAPYGTAVTVTPPFNNPYLRTGTTSPDNITVTDGSGRKLAGCYVDSEDGDPGFVPDNALQPNTTYTAHATWGGRYPDFQWTFTTADGPPNPPETTPQRKTLRIQVRKRGTHRIRIDANPDTTKTGYRLRVQRHTKRWNTIKKLTAPAPKHRATIRLAKTGRYRVVGVAQSGLRAGHSRTITIR